MSISKTKTTGRQPRRKKTLREDDVRAADGVIRGVSSDEEDTEHPILQPVFLQKERQKAAKKPDDTAKWTPHDDYDRYDVDDNVGVPEVRPRADKATKRQHQYLQQFVDRSDSLLGALLDRECQPSTTICASPDCSELARWRCRECTLALALCRGCMRRTHLYNTFHRIEHWEGTHFRAATLREVGCYLLVGHREGLSICEHLRSQVSELDKLEGQYDRAAASGERNRSAATNQNTDVPAQNELDTESQPIDQILEEDEDEDDQLDDDWDLDEMAAGSTTSEYNGHREYIFPAQELDATSSERFSSTVPRHNRLLQKIVRVVHINGIHHIALLSCACRGPGEICLDLMYRRLVVTSFVNHRTLFTADVLDYFRLVNLELNGSAYQFFQLLRRLTLPLAPGEAPNLYHELRRLSRLWRWLKKRKWSGEGHGSASDEAKASGSMVPFCPACPQPNRNLPKDWKWNIIQWIYTRYFVIDGNFKADHVRQKQPALDLWLSVGRGMMPDPASYALFLQSAIERSTKAPCETHFRAIEQAMLSSKACDITGVIAVACARHGCYAPRSLCNLFKGEQQKNADYAFLQALETTDVDPQQGVMIMYDIACQYCIYLRERIGHLLPRGLKIDRAIGLFHVHGHKEQCFFRYSPSFIPHSGKVAGEILESLWSVLNRIAPSTRTATLPHRAEILDDHTSDSNHKKGIGMADFICAKYPDAIEMARLSMAYFESLDAAASPEEQNEWGLEIRDAEEHRLDIPSKMDIYGSKAASTLQTEQDPLPPADEARGPVEGFLRVVLEIEAKQIDIQDRLRRLRKEPREEERQEVEALRQQLVNEFAVMQLLQAAVIPAALNTTREIYDQQPDAFDNLDEMVLDEDNFGTPLESTVPDAVETRPLPLPSLGVVPPTSDIAQLELVLRQEQANEHLAALRDAIAHKSLQFSDVIRAAPRKSVRTKSRALIAKINQQISLRCRGYKRCRAALHRLTTDLGILDTFPELLPEHVRGSTALRQPNLAGSTELRLSWIWQHNGTTLGEPISGTTEYKRVHWLRGRAESHRWAEEVILLTNEMQWTVLDYEYQAKAWERLCASDNSRPGPAAYAAKKAHLWHRMAAVADAKFATVCSTHKRLNQ